MGAKVVFFIGKPGCGKGTQARLLSEQTGWQVFSSGKLFRAIAEEDTFAGRKSKKELAEGLLMPHWFAMYLYLKKLFELSDNESAIFDGFNRKEDEAKLIMDSMRWLGRDYQVINIEVSDKAVQERLLKRYEAEKRDDDLSVDMRLIEYRTYTEPTLEIFKEAGVLYNINGEETPEEIAKKVREVVGA